MAAGRDAERIAHLFTVMAAGALIVWAAMVAIGVYAIRTRRRKHSHDTANLLIIGGGVGLPSATLAALLIYGLPILPEILTLPPEGSLRIEVSAKQWWWRVRYLVEAGAIETANELRLPVGQRVEVRLASSDVIHSFWVPSLAGKADMIPGRLTRIALEPLRTGVFQGACAEYCGASHARMAFVVLVMEPQEFRTWLERQAQPASTPLEAPAAQGQTAFVANGCGACHTIRGTAADGTVGPDLTHVGSRLRLAGGALENEPQSFVQWIARSNAVKPGSHMPPFWMLPSDDLSALAAYLHGLR